MRRRSRAGGRAAKTRTRKTVKCGPAPKNVRRPSVSAGQETIVRQLTRERDEALLREAAHAEILHLISMSPGDLELVLRSILENATRICNANFGTLLRFEGQRFHPAAQFNTPTAFWEELTRRGPFEARPSRTLAHLMETMQVDHVADMAVTDPQSLITRLGGARTLLNVPMIREKELIGVIGIYRQEVLPFTDKQISLLQNFAAQAVIAIENARLLNELRQRTDDLGEALEQQTATSEVLKVISSSPGELEPVFHTVLENAVKLCEAKFGTLFLFDGICFRVGAAFNVPAPLADYQAKTGAFVPPPGLPLARLVETKKVAHMLDDPEGLSPATKLGGARTHIAVPMLKEGKIAGAIYIYRQEVKPFAEKQIALVQNFAAQAVIAIENARLLSELRQRTNDLSESLEQQTATSEILDVISNSPTDSQPAFNAIVRSGLRLFPDAAIMIGLLDGDVVRCAAVADADPAGAEALRARTPLPLSREFITSTAILDRREIDLPDVREAPAELAAGARNFLASGYRAQTVVPMMRGEAAIGTVNVVRRRPGPLSDKQRELLRIFANQAVIAIENTRLFSELRQRTNDLSESLEQQTATSEVLNVISSSPGELKRVFQAILQNATGICEAKFGNLWLREGNKFRIVETHRAPLKYREYLTSEPLVDPEPGSAMDRISRTGGVVHIDDITTAPTYESRMRTATIELAKARSLVGVPMLKDSDVIGIIAIYRQEVQPFTDKQIALVQNFAAQAVIAIENARLLNELRESLQQQTATADVLKVISTSPGELEPVFQAML